MWGCAMDFKKSSISIDEEFVFIARLIASVLGFEFKEESDTCLTLRNFFIELCKFLGCKR